MNMKKFLIFLQCAFILFCMAGCDSVKTNEQPSENNRQETSLESIENEQNANEDKNIKENEKEVSWNEITGEGVDEQALFDSIDIGLLETIANNFQNLDKEICEKERISQEYVLRGDWLKNVIESEQYQSVISIGNDAMKPLYWIIYKSNNQGRYEYMCALALEELSGLDFDEDGDGMKWSTSKEFLEEFDKKIIESDK